MKPQDEQVVLINGTDLNPNDIEKLNKIGNSEKSLLNLNLETIGMRSNIFFYNYLYFFLSNIITNIIISFINNKYTNSSNYVIAIGALSTMYNFFFLPIIMGSASIIEIIGTQAYISGNYKLFGYYMHRIRIIGHIALMISSLIIYFSSDYFLSLFDYNLSSRIMIRNLLVLRIISVFFELEYIVIHRYLQIINKGLIGILLSIVSGCLIFFYCFFFINVLNLSEIAIGLVFILNSMTNLILVWIYVLIFKPLEEAIFFFQEKSYSDILEMLTLTFPSMISSILDNTNNEVMSIFFNFNKNEYPAFVIAYSFYMSIGGASNSFLILSNLMISFYNAKRNIINLQSMLFCLIFDGLIIGSICLIIIIPCRHFLISINNVKDVNTANLAATFLALLFVSNFLDIIMQILLGSIKGLKKIYTCMFLYLINNSFNILFIFIGNRLYGGIGIIYGYMVNNIFSIILFSFVLYFIDWKECIDECTEELEKDASKIF